MKNNVVRSPLFYVGDKYKLISEIKKYFPEKINRFIEPFVGGGSVFMNVEADCFLLNDIDTNIIEIHKMLCEYADKRDEFYSEFERGLLIFGRISKFEIELKITDIKEISFVYSEKAI